MSGCPVTGIIRWGLLGAGVQMAMAAWGLAPAWFGRVRRAAGPGAANGSARPDGDGKVPPGEVL